MRRKDREVTDINIIKQFIEENKVCHLAMVDDHKPYVVPLNYGYTFEDDKLVFYFHSASQGRKLDILKQNSNVCIEIAQDQGLAGEGNIACVYGYYFMSLIGEGKAEFIEDHEAKLNALRSLMIHFTGKDDYEYQPKMVDMITIIKVTLDTYSVKARQ